MTSPGWWSSNAVRSPAHNTCTLTDRCIGTPRQLSRYPVIMTASKGTYTLAAIDRAIDHGLFSHALRFPVCENRAAYLPCLPSISQKSRLPARSVARTTAFYPAPNRVPIALPATCLSIPRAINGISLGIRRPRLPALQLCHWPCHRLHRWQVSRTVCHCDGVHAPVSSSTLLRCRPMDGPTPVRHH